MDRFNFCILFLLLYVNSLNSIVVQVKPYIHAKDLYLSVSNVASKKTQVDAEKMSNLRPTKTNSYSRRNESVFENQRIFKIDNATKHVTGSLPRSVIRRAPQPYPYVAHQTKNVKPIYELETDSTINLAENLHTGYSYDPPSIPVDLYNKYESKNTQGSCTPEEIVASIEKLDHLLKPILNSDSYNSPVHPPTNPVLALILSRYGRYLGRDPSSNVYSYMAVNNIHNTKPFGQYKYE